MDEDYNNIFDSLLWPEEPGDYGIIRRMTLNLLRQELPDYVARILPSE